MALSKDSKDVEKAHDQSQPESGIQPDLFEENFKELKKWVDVKSSKYGTLLVLRERRSGRLGTALKVFFFIIHVHLLSVRIMELYVSRLQKNIYCS